MVQATRTHVTFRVPAIIDGRAIRTIHETLAAVDGVSNVHASVETKFVDVDIEPAKVTAERVGEFLGEAGYPPQIQS